MEEARSPAGWDTIGGMKVKVQAHVAYQTRYHVVWIPKFRKKVLVAGVKEYLEKTIQTTVIDRYPDVYIIELNVQVDHVHALVEIPPKYSVSSVVGYIKGVTSRNMRMHFEFLRHVRSICGQMDSMSVRLAMMNIRFEITFGIKISRRAVKLCLHQARYHGL